MKRVAIVGGGISGLAAAYKLRNSADVLLFEAGAHLGGAIRTYCREGYLLETGPDAFLNKGGMMDLCGELGIKDELIETRREHPRSFLARGKRLIPVPDGLYLMAPASLGAFVRSPIVSPFTKVRMAFDLVIPRRADDGDETLASFVRRRLGRGALEELAQPLVGGIYTADPERLSLAATMPQFLEMERKHGSVIRALLRQRRKIGHASGARYSLFLSFRNGMQTLVDALAKQLPAPKLGAAVTGLRRDGEMWHLTINGAEEALVDAVCLCVPTTVVRQLLPALPDTRVSYTSSATINFGFRQEQIGHALDGMGLVVPEVERRFIMACSFSSQKFEGRAPQGRVLLRAFLGGAFRANQLTQSDEELASLALHDVRDLLRIEGDPELIQVNRWPHSMPQYELGHLERVDALEAAVGKLPRLALAGKSYRGVGIPDCVASGSRAAERLLPALG